MNIKEQMQLIESEKGNPEKGEKWGTWFWIVLVSFAFGSVIAAIFITSFLR